MQVLLVAEVAEQHRGVATDTEHIAQRVFDAGEDVLDYFDLKRAFVRHGGARSGSGRKNLGKIRKQVLLSKAVVAKVDFIAKKKHLSFSAAVETACAALR